MNALSLLTGSYSEFFEGFSRGFREGPIGLRAAIFLVLGLASLLVAGLLAHKRYLRKVQSEIAAPQARHGLFERLCQEHALERAQKTILLDMASRAGLAEPSELFVRPALFDKLVPASSGREEASETFERLRRRLYGDGQR